MTTGEESTARPLPAGRLSGFEGDDDDERSAQLRTLLQRSPTSSSPVPERTAAPASDQVLAAAEPGMAASEVRPLPPAAKDAELRRPRAQPRRARPRRERRPAAGVTATTGGAATRASTVWIPESLFEQIEAYVQRTQLSNGEVLIAALEAIDEQRLGERLTRAGGGRFAARPSRARQEIGPYKIWNFRMRPEDFDTYDDIVASVNAASRAQLATAALAAFFSEGGPGR